MRDLLGEVLFGMGDLPAAARAWFLTQRDDEEARAAINAYRRRYRRDLGGLLSTIPAHVPLEEWPPAVRERLVALQAEATAAGLRWSASGSPKTPPATAERAGGGLPWVIAIAAILAVLVALIVGVVTLVGWVV